MHIRAGAKGSVGFVIFKEKLFPETLDLHTSQVFICIHHRFSKQNRCPRMSESGQKRKLSRLNGMSGLPPEADITRTAHWPI
jgi:hypothetical protein